MHEAISPGRAIQPRTPIHGSDNRRERLLSVQYPSSYLPFSVLVDVLFHRTINYSRECRLLPRRPLLVITRVKQRRARSTLTWLTAMSADSVIVGRFKGRRWGHRVEPTPRPASGLHDPPTLRGVPSSSSKIGLDIFKVLTTTTNVTQFNSTWIFFIHHHKCDNEIQY